MNTPSTAGSHRVLRVSPRCEQAVLSVALGSIMWSVSGSTCGAQREIAVPDHGPLQSARYQSETNALQLQFAGGDPIEIRLDPSARIWENFLLIGPDKTAAPDLVRFCSPACYAAYGQENDGVILYSSRTTLAGIKTTGDNSFVLQHPKAAEVTLLDWRFASSYMFARQRNAIVPNRPLCKHAKPLGLLAGVRDEDCYVVCSGLARIVVSLVGPQARTVPLVGRTDTLDGGYRFLWSEWHTTMELSVAGTSYVADPSYGFAYVKDRASGRRLKSSELVEALHGGRADNLVFGTIHDGAIHDVPGGSMLAANPSIAALFYTPDKKLDGAKRGKPFAQRVATFLGLD